MLPRVLVVTCGGTIASRTRPDAAGAAPSADADELIGAVPILSQLARLHGVVHSTVPSSFATLHDVLELHRRIGGLVDQAQVSGDPFTGVVVTHGTDTLEEVAFALDLLWRRDEPLVTTGAMRHADLPGADGPANLLAAVATAIEPAARGLGVLVVLNEVIHAARLVRKTHTSNVATFEAPGVGPLGYVTETRASLLLMPRARLGLEAPPPAADIGAIALLKLGLGDDARALATATAVGCAGVVIESLGGGHLPPAVAVSTEFDDILRRLPVVIASRTGAGSTLAGTYDFTGSELWLSRRGVLFSGALDGPKSRVLLAMLIGTGLVGAVLAERFGAIARSSA